VRVNFNYFISETVFEFVLKAVHLVAEHGWRMVPQYDFDTMTALWTHHEGTGPAPMSLTDLRFTPDGIEHPQRRRTEPETVLADYLVEGERIMREATAGDGEVSRPDVTEDFERLRWFHLPDELRRELLDV
jgi:hypothetical protein